MNNTRIRSLSTALIIGAGIALAGPATAYAAPAPVPQQTATIIGGDTADALGQILRSIAQASNTGSAVPLPPCTPGDVINIGCEPRG